MGAESSSFSLLSFLGGAVTVGGGGEVVELLFYRDERKVKAIAKDRFRIQIK